MLEEGPREVIGEHNICIIFFIFLFICSFSPLCLLPPVLPPIAVLQVPNSWITRLTEVGPGVDGCRQITYKYIILWSERREARGRLITGGPNR